MADTFSEGDVVLFKDRAAWTVNGRHGVDLREACKESEHQYDLSIWPRSCGAQLQRNAALSFYAAMSGRGCVQRA